MLFRQLIAIFRVIIIGSFIFSFVSFTFLGGSFQVTLINMVFSVGLLLLVKDPSKQLINSFVMLLENEDDTDR